MSGWWSRRSLRFRLALWYAIAGSVLLAGFSLTVYGFVRHRMAQPLDHRLRGQLAVLQRALTVDAEGRVYWHGNLLHERSVWPADYPWFELWNAAGQLVYRRWPFAERRIERLPSAPAPGREILSVFSLTPEVRLRGLSVPFPVEAWQETWMLRTLSTHEPNSDALDDLLFILGVSLPVVIALLVLGGYAITRRWLRPLQQMVDEAQQISADDLERRISGQCAGAELGRLAAAFNTTLARLENSFRALDRFVADAAHELLTPLTSLRSTGEVALRVPRSADAYREVIASMLEETQRLQLLIEKLLQLARAEGGANLVQRTRVELRELLRECADDARVLADDREQRVRVSCSACELETDPLLLRQVIQNLLDNAIKYSEPGREVQVLGSQSAREVTITVADHGCGISAEHLPRIFERFYRVDKARSRKLGGTGLGLAIVKHIIQAHGGRVTVKSTLGVGSTFTIHLPRPAETQAPSFATRSA